MEKEERNARVVSELRNLLSGRPELLEEAARFIRTREETIAKWLRGEQAPIGGGTTLRAEGFLRKQGILPMLDPRLSEGVVGWLTWLIADLGEDPKELTGIFDNSVSTILRWASGEMEPLGDTCLIVEWYLHSKRGLRQMNRFSFLTPEVAQLAALIGKRVLTIGKVAKEADLSIENMRTWLRGANKPSPEANQRLQDYLESSGIIPIDLSFHPDEKLLSLLDHPQPTKPEPEVPVMATDLVEVTAEVMNPPVPAATPVPAEEPAEQLAATLEAAEELAASSLAIRPEPPSDWPEGESVPEPAVMYLAPPSASLPPSTEDLILAWAGPLTDILTGYLRNLQPSQAAERLETLRQRDEKMFFRLVNAVQCIGNPEAYRNYRRSSH